MDVVIGERGSGRTQAAVDWLLANPTGIVLSPLVTMSFEIRRRYAEAKAALGGTVNQAWLEQHILPMEHRDRLRGVARTTPLWIDDADIVLGALMGWPLPIAGVGLTGTPTHLMPNPIGD